MKVINWLDRYLNIIGICVFVLGGALYQFHIMGWYVLFVAGSIITMMVLVVGLINGGHNE
jgi:hypothetical protein